MEFIVKPYGVAGAHITVPKKYLGVKVTVLLPDEKPIELRPTPVGDSFVKKMLETQERPINEAEKEMVGLLKLPEPTLFKSQELLDKEKFLEGWKKLKGNPLKEFMREWRNKAGSDTVDRWMEG